MYEYMNRCGGCMRQGTNKRKKKPMRKQQQQQEEVKVKEQVSE